jgi:uncharacterized protein YjbJ (UPF0337 family)
MEWARIQANWKHYKGNARRHWMKLSEEALELVAGNREQLAQKLREVYGLSEELAEKQLAEWQRAQRERNPFR